MSIFDKMFENKIQDMSGMSDELKALVEVTRQTIDDCGEISKVMVEHEVKIEDAVGDIYKTIMEGK